MEKWIEGNTYARTSSVKGDVVTIKHVTLLKDGKHYMTTKVDLSGESAEDIKINAAYNMLIQVLRPRTLKPHKSTEIDETKALKPCDYPGGKGGGKPFRESLITWMVETLGIKKDLAEKWADDPEAMKNLIAKHGR